MVNSSHFESYKSVVMVTLKIIWRSRRYHARIVQFKVSSLGTNGTTIAIATNK